MSAAGTTNYVEPGLYEEVLTSTGIEQLHYVYAGNLPVALYTQSCTSSSSCSTTLTAYTSCTVNNTNGVQTKTCTTQNSANGGDEYLHTDHLGSVVVITDQWGASSETDSYDAWGKRRYTSGQDAPSGSITSSIPRGFTFQEHLDDVALIHMNGRVYDPLLGRFISADPYVQHPWSTQGFNGYTYVRNNPLSLTDPSGYDDVGGAFDFGLPPEGPTGGTEGLTPQGTNSDGSQPVTSGSGNATVVPAQPDNGGVSGNTQMQVAGSPDGSDTNSANDNTEYGPNASAPSTDQGNDPTNNFDGNYLTGFLSILPEGMEAKHSGCH